MDTTQREALEHLRKAAALLDAASPHLAVRVRAIANGIETSTTAQADYRESRSAGR